MQEVKEEGPFMSETYVYVWLWSVESVMDVGSRLEDGGEFQLKARINGPGITILGYIT